MENQAQQTADPAEAALTPAEAGGDAPAPAPAPTPAPEPAPRARRGGFWEWLTRRGALSEARSQLREGRPEVRDLVRRARAACELADRIYDGYEPLPSGRGHCFAADLYRQSTYWSLATLHEASGAPPDGTSASPDTLWKLVSSLDEIKLPAEPAARDEVEGLFSSGDFRVFAEISQADQLRVATYFRELAQSALQTSEPAEHAIRHLKFQRLTRSIAFAVLLAVLSVLAVVSLSLLIHNPNLAAGKPWKASSVWAECQPVLRQCGTLKSDIFFHTKEDASPWLQYDLGKPTRVGEVYVKNRSDAVPDRAVPLVIEVSNDAKKWKEVMRRAETFSTWTAKFAPQNARYVRLRVDRRSQFHLDAVEIRGP